MADQGPRGVTTTDETLQDATGKSEEDRTPAEQAVVNQDEAFTSGQENSV